MKADLQGKLRSGRSVPSIAKEQGVTREGVYWHIRREPETFIAYLIGKIIRWARHRARTGPGGEGRLRYSREDLIEVLERFLAESDKRGAAAYRAWAKGKDVPSVTTLSRRFGSWSAALATVGVRGRSRATSTRYDLEATYSWARRVWLDGGSRGFWQRWEKGRPANVASAKSCQYRWGSARRLVEEAFGGKL